MSSIASIRAREILDSRGNPTVEVDVELADGSRGRAAVPSGASSGAFEAVELRDGDPRRFRGLGVTRAVENVERRIAPAVAGLSADDQSAVDRVLIEVDGTPNKEALGANAILGVSLAVARAAAASSGQPLYQYLAGDAPVTLPAPMFNIINGGRHADDSTDFQEFMVVAAGFDRFSDALRAGVETYHALGDILRGRRAATGLGDEGGFAPPLTTNEEAVGLALTAIEEAGYVPGEHCFLAMDVAASELVLDDGRYALLREGAILEPGQLLDQYERWTRQYPIISIEDGLAEEDWPHWQSLTERLGASLQIVGDDLFVTNTDRLRRGIETASANAVLVKLNQVGTVSETLDAVRMAKEKGWGTVISHRSGETGDDSIADLAVGTAAGQIKAGAPARGERTAKYNRLLRIEEELGDRAEFAGLDAYRAVAPGSPWLGGP